MILAQYIIGFFFGVSIGSFLGVVIERQTANDKRQTTNIGGRSRCGSCKKQLKWLDNIPLVSYVFLRGKCRTCRSPIPYWLPLIELAGGIGGIWVIREIGEIGVMGGIGAMLIAAALVWTLFSDLVYGVIPDLAIGAGVAGAIGMKSVFPLSGTGGASSARHTAKPPSAAAIMAWHHYNTEVL